ncbi:MAG: NADH-quinone oxidoreductase subunit C [Bacteroidales bacterium]|jgi:NADH:ubiquinone oxidoreductase subunit C|nr:NADH-quinone oxidoreductase subunit C [Bacteroidales bacterium]
MDNVQLKELVTSLLPDATFEESKQFLMVTVAPGQLHDLLARLKNGSDTWFDFLFCISGVDLAGKLMVVYHLESTTLGHQIVLKTGTENREKPELDSIVDLYKGAELHENEIFDLFGIIFKGHPNLRRMFMPDDWNGYPLRKDYVDEVNIIDLS